MLSKLQSVPLPEQKGNFVFDLRPFGTDGELAFREPKAADLFPDGAESKAASIAFPEFKDAMLYQIMVMGRCYVTSEAEMGQIIQPWRALGQFGRDHRDLFIHLAAQFSDAFPTGSVEHLRKNVGNVSTE
jgi:hypothetical protein